MEHRGLREREKTKGLCQSSAIARHGRHQLSIVTSVQMDEEEEEEGEGGEEEAS